MPRIRVASTSELEPNELRTLRRLMDGSFVGEETFTEDDWDHTLGGVHVIALESDVVAHAAVVERFLRTDERAFRTGYVEGVATATGYRNRGYGSAVMKAVADIIGQRSELGALGTGAHGFYERLGWERWLGPTCVDSPTGLERTPEDDDGVMILRTSATGGLDRTSRLICDWREGDVW